MISLRNLHVEEGKGGGRGKGTRKREGDVDQNYHFSKEIKCRK
jgi:hypothetical protein